MPQSTPLRGEANGKTSPCQPHPDISSGWVESFVRRRVCRSPPCGYSRRARRRVAPRFWWDTLSHTYPDSPPIRGTHSTLRHPRIFARCRLLTVLPFSFSRRSVRHCDAAPCRNPRLPEERRILRTT